MYNRINISLPSYDEAEEFYLTLMLRAALHDINPRGINAGVTQQVRQFRYVFPLTVKRHGEQMPEVVRKHFTRVYAGGGTESPQGFPDVAPVHGLAAFCHEYRSAGNLCNPGESSEVSRAVK